MPEIKCPNCGNVFKVDESEYLDIVNQIKNQEFEKELNAKLNAALENAKLQSSLDLTKKDNEITFLKGEIEKAKRDTADASKDTISSLRDEITKLNSDIKVLKAQNQADIQTAISDKNIEINNLKNSLSLKDQENKLEQNKMKELYEQKLEDAEEQIAHYKDFKAKLSTKLVGESLEQYCNNAFNQYRSTLFANSYFEKDNEVSKDSGSKGDFIFKDSVDGIEYISIMFDMKNENETTATKKKNEDFFAELDKDRNEKHCEYAVLVSMLELDNEFYNAGIVDVSYRYPKMYVIRPQCFLSMITLLMNANKKTLDTKKALVEYQTQNMDITHFEEDLDIIKTNLDKNYNLAKDKFAKAIEEIDKTIEHLSKVKEQLMGSDKNLRILNDKVQDLSIKKLTKNNPTMAKKFEELKKDK